MAKRWRSKGHFKGVYLIFIANYLTKEKRLIYVGSSKNIRNRIEKHNKWHTWFSLLEDFEFIYDMCRECENNIEFEKWLIKRLHPKLNKQHNGLKRSTLPTAIHTGLLNG